MNSTVDKKRVLVTGSSRGIGFFIAERFSKKGSRVVINSRNKEALENASQNLNDTIPLAGDLSDPKSATNLINETVEKLGGLDILICNVGGGVSVAPGLENFNEWQRIFALNMWSTTNAVEAAKPFLAETRGNIVCISSICGQETIVNAPVAYTAAKAALNAYVKAISRPLGEEGIRINAVAPGNILFEGSVWDKKMKQDPKTVEKLLSDDIPLSRLGSPEEVAALVVFLASSDADFITGSIFSIDGGQTRS